MTFRPATTRCGLAGLIEVTRLTDSGFARSDPASRPVTKGRSGSWDRHDHGAVQQSDGIPAAAFADRASPLVRDPSAEARA
jgi:hypothetical protein